MRWISFVVFALTFALTVGVTSTAEATVVTPLASFNQVSFVGVAGGDESGGSLLVETRPQSSLDGSYSLLGLTPSAPPFRLAHSRGNVAGAVSPNGRFLAWSEGACHNLALSGVDTAISPASARIVDAPGGFATAVVQGISVSSGGRVTALVSTYDPVQCRSPSSAPPGTRYAVLSAGPSDQSLSVVASVPGVVAANNFAGVESTGSFGASPDASTFALCAYPRSGAEGGTNRCVEPNPLLGSPRGHHYFYEPRGCQLRRLRRRRGDDDRLRPTSHISRHNRRPRSPDIRALSNRETLFSNNESLWSSGTS